MRVGRQPPARGQFPSIILELSFAEAALQVGAGVDSRRCMRLGHDDVTAIVVGAVPETVMKTHFQHGRGGGIRCDMPPDPHATVRSPQHHGHGIPADDILDPLFKFDVTRILRLFCG